MIGDVYTIRTRTEGDARALAARLYAADPSVRREGTALTTRATLEVLAKETCSYEGPRAVAVERVET